MEVGNVKVTCKENLSDTDWCNAGLITDIHGPKIIVKSDTGYELHLTPINISTGKIGVWMADHNPGDLISMRAEFIGEHGIRLEDGSIIKPYVQEFNIRDALGLND